MEKGVWQFINGDEQELVLSATIVEFKTLKK